MYVDRKADDIDDLGFNELAEYGQEIYNHGQ